MMDREQYVETLIKLIELNRDQSWTSTFRGLRKGGSLPGGGQGSLNDWGPSYIDEFRDVWYRDLYEILRFLFDDKLSPESLRDDKRLANNDKLHILRCAYCNGRYQHPSIFESHIAKKFYNERFAEFYNSKKLVDILIPSLSYESPSIKLYRDGMKKEYQRLGIKIYDFVRGKYICGHCSLRDSGSHFSDLYMVEKTHFGEIKINHIKDNPPYNEFV